MKGDITKYISVKAINSSKLLIGSSSIFIASLIPTPNIKIGIIRGMINIGNKIFPLFAPNTNEAPIKPTKDIASPPIVMLASNQGVCLRSISSKIKNIGVLKIKGMITINQYEILFDNKIISRGMGLVSNWSNHPFSK